MAVAIVGAFALGIMVLGTFFLCALGVASIVAPFSSGALFSIMICETVPGAKGIVPGHTFLNYLVILLIVETIVVILIHIPQISMPMNVLLTSFFISCIGLLFLHPIHTSSVGLCIFLSVIYIAAAAVVLRMNIENWDFDEGDCNVFFRILASLIYAFSVLLMAIPLIGSLWQKVFEEEEIFFWICFILTSGAAIVAGIFGWKETD